MLYNQNNLRDERDDQSAQQQQQARNERNITEMSGRPTEGQGVGGHNFGREGSATPMGDDKDNPSRYAGTTNAYFNRVAPTEEDTANNNFKAAHQEGEPDYAAAHNQTNIPGPQEVPDQQKVGEESSNTQETQEQPYHEPGLDEPQPDHGSGATETGEEREHIET